MYPEAKAYRKDHLIASVYSRTRAKVLESSHIIDLAHRRLATSIPKRLCRLGIAGRLLDGSIDITRDMNSV